MHRLIFLGWTTELTQAKLSSIRFILWLISNILSTRSMMNLWDEIICSQQLRPPPDYAVHTNAGDCTSFIWWRCHMYCVGWTIKKIVIWSIGECWVNGRTYDRQDGNETEKIVVSWVHARLAVDSSIEGSVYGECISPVIIFNARPNGKVDHYYLMNNIYN